MDRRYFVLQTKTSGRGGGGGGFMPFIIMIIIPPVQSFLFKQKSSTENNNNHTPFGIFSRSRVGKWHTHTKHTHTHTHRGWINRNPGYSLIQCVYAEMFAEEPYTFISFFLVTREMKILELK